MQILFQNLRFSYNGSIDGWNGTISLSSTFAGNIDSSAPLIYLQVWRPSKQRTMYSLVGSFPLTLDMISNISEATAMWDNSISFQLNTSGGEGEESIYFKQDDILGIYFLNGVNESGVTTNPGSEMLEVEMLMEDLKFSSAQVECQISVCDEALQIAKPRIPTILPYCTRK